MVSPVESLWVQTENAGRKFTAKSSQKQAKTGRIIKFRRVCTVLYGIRKLRLYNILPPCGEENARSERGNFGSPAFLDDLPENTLHRAVVQRPMIVFLDPFQNDLLALRVVYPHSSIRLDFSYFDGASGALVQQFDNLRIDRIDPNTPVVDIIHSGAFPQKKTVIKSRIKYNHPEAGNATPPFEEWFCGMEEHNYKEGKRLQTYLHGEEVRGAGNQCT
jgi:hypothetical protein